MDVGRIEVSSERSLTGLESSHEAASPQSGFVPAAMLHGANQQPSDSCRTAKSPAVANRAPGLKRWPSTSEAEAQALKVAAFREAAGVPNASSAAGLGSENPFGPRMKSTNSCASCSEYNASIRPSCDRSLPHSNRIKSSHYSSKAQDVCTLCMILCHTSMNVTLATPLTAIQRHLREAVLE